MPRIDITTKTRAAARFCAFSLLVLLGACDYSMIKDQPVAPPTGSNGNGNDTARVSITVTPTSSVVTVGSRFRFLATVTGSSNQAVAWRLVSGPGEVDQNGFYTAPATIASDTVVAELRAIAQADTTLSVTAKAFVVRASDGGGGGGGSQVLCFERDVLPIFTSNCAMSGCHDVATAEEGFILTSYSGISEGVVPGNPEASIIYNMITGRGKDGVGDDNDDDIDDNDDDNDDDGSDDDDIMPPPPQSPLTPAQIETIRRWIAEGASGEPCPPQTGTCDTTNITYSGVVSTILQNNCTGCHSGASPPRGINLTTHAGVVAASANGRLVGSISHASGYVQMPYNTNKLQECQILQIRTWVERGAPNN